jgi:hypothetical protein
MFVEMTDQISFHKLPIKECSAHDMAKESIIDKVIIMAGYICIMGRRIYL